MLWLVDVQTIHKHPFYDRYSTKKFKTKYFTCIHALKAFLVKLSEEWGTPGIDVDAWAESVIGGEENQIGWDTYRDTIRVKVVQTVINPTEIWKNESHTPFILSEEQIEKLNYENKS